MGIVKKHTPKIDRQLGVSNLNSNVSNRVDQHSFAYSTPKISKEDPISNIRQTGSIKAFIRRSLPSGDQTCRTRLPSPHWRHRYSLPTTVSNSRTDPELQVKLLHRSCSSTALSLSNSEPNISLVSPRQSRSRRKSLPHANGGNQADLLRRRCLKGDAIFDKPFYLQRLSSTCPAISLPIHISLPIEPFQNVKDTEEEKHPLKKIWERNLSYHNFEDDINEVDTSFFTFNNDLYDGVDL